LACNDAAIIFPENYVDRLSQLGEMADALDADD